MPGPHIAKRSATWSPLCRLIRWQDVTTPNHTQGETEPGFKLKSAQLGPVLWYWQACSHYILLTFKIIPGFKNPFSHKPSRGNKTWLKITTVLRNVFPFSTEWDLQLTDPQHSGGRGAGKADSGQGLSLCEWRHVGKQPGVLGEWHSGQRGWAGRWAMAWPPQKSPGLVPATASHLSVVKRRGWHRQTARLLCAGSPQVPPGERLVARLLSSQQQEGQGWAGCLHLPPGLSSFLTAPGEPGPFPILHDSSLFWIFCIPAPSSGPSIHLRICHLGKKKIKPAFSFLNLIKVCVVWLLTAAI